MNKHLKYITRKIITIYAYSKENKHREEVPEHQERPLPEPEPETK